jgi:hypothetical protein
MEAQQDAVAAHVASSGCTLVGTYTEIETGKRDSLDNRPELRRAIAHAVESLETAAAEKLSAALAGAVADQVRETTVKSATTARKKARKTGAADWNRTSNLGLRSALLYPN